MKGAICYYVVVQTPAQSFCVIRVTSNHVTYVNSYGGLHVVSKSVLRGYKHVCSPIFCVLK